MGIERDMAQPGIDRWGAAKRKTHPSVTELITASAYMDDEQFKYHCRDKPNYYKLKKAALEAKALEAKAKEKAKKK